MIRYKIDVLDALKKKGLSTYKLRQDKLISETTVMKLRKSEMIGLKPLDQLCALLECDVGDIIQYEDSAEQNENTQKQRRRGMKKIINHKLYNTETAELIGEYGNDAPRSDFSHFSECLYKTKKGNYFLYGEGGPMSKYATPCGQNEVSGGEEIHPMTADEAMTWAENHLDADDFMEAFGEVEEA